MESVMAEAGVSVTQFATKSHNTPDEVRSPNKTRVEIVRLPGYTLGRFNLEPGWRWSECIKPVVKTNSCQVPHVGHVVSGRLTVKLDDGTQKTFEPGMSYTIPPGHDAWVEGKEGFVCIEVLSAEQYARA
jgi:quercetin dioxygenase-like cupin family protein